MHYKNCDLENTHGHGSLAGYTPWSRKQLDMTEQLSTASCGGIVATSVSLEGCTAVSVGLESRTLGAVVRW